MRRRRGGARPHELRHALATATYAFDALRGGSVGNAGRTAAMLERSLGTMGALVNHALAEAQLKEAATHVERVSLVELVEQLDVVAPAGKQLRLVVDVPRDLAVDVDRRLFVSVLGSLLQNRMELTHDGGQVTIRGSSAGSAVVVEVEDECGGSTVDPEELFAPFVQRHADRSGIGLASRSRARRSNASAAACTRAIYPGRAACS